MPEKTLGGLIRALKGRIMRPLSALALLGVLLSVGTARVPRGIAGGPAGPGRVGRGEHKSIHHIRAEAITNVLLFCEARRCATVGSQVPALQTIAIGCASAISMSRNLEVVFGSSP